MPWLAVMRPRRAQRLLERRRRLQEERSALERELRETVARRVDLLWQVEELALQEGAATSSALAALGSSGVALVALVLEAATYVSAGSNLAGVDHENLVYAPWPSLLAVASFTSLVLAPSLVCAHFVVRELHR